MVITFEILEIAGDQFASAALGISSSGDHVAGFAAGPGGQPAMMWSDPWTGLAGRRELGVVSGAVQASALALSDDGTVVVGESYGPQFGSVAFRWTSATGAMPLSPLDEPDTSAVDVSADGSVIVGTKSTANGSDAFRWTAATGIIPLSPSGEPGAYFDASGISGNGTLIIGSRSTANSEIGQAGYWLNGGSFVPLDDLAGGEVSSHAYGVAPDASVIVGDSNSSAGREPTIWTLQSGAVSLNQTGGTSFLGAATDASVGGSTIVGYVEDATRVPFIWDNAHGIRRLQAVLVNEYSLNLGNWQLINATGISADASRIVGVAFDAQQSINRAYMVTLPVPEPSTFILLLVGVKAAILTRWRFK